MRQAELILQRFPNLAELDLSQAAASVDNNTVAQLCQLRKLRTLNLQGCARVRTVCCCLILAGGEALSKQASTGPCTALIALCSHVHGSRGGAACC